MHTKKMHMHFLVLKTTCKIKSLSMSTHPRVECATYSQLVHCPKVCKCSHSQQRGEVYKWCELR